MSIVEFLESSKDVVLGADDSLWFTGWMHSHIMGTAYDGWKELSADRYEQFAAWVCDYIVYVKTCTKSLSDHYVNNEPGESFESSVSAGQRGGYEQH